MGPELDRAGAGLQSTDESTELSGATRGHERHDSLGIGTFGEGMAELQGLPSIYARSGERLEVGSLKGAPRRRAEAVLAEATARVAECYGEPRRDGSSRDALAVRVIFDSTGRVVVANVVHPTRFGARGTEACVTEMLQGARFTPGLTESVAQVGYRWTFDLGAPTRLVFAPEPQAAAVTP